MFRKKGIITAIGLVLNLLLLFTSCGDYSEHVEAGERFRLRITLCGGATRSSDLPFMDSPGTLDNFHLYVFDSDGTMVGSLRKDTHELGNNIDLSLSLSDKTDGLKIYVAANLPEDSFGVTVSADMLDSLTFEVDDLSMSALPMSGFKRVIIRGEESCLDIELELERCVAFLTVEDSEGGNVTSISVDEYNERGYVFKGEASSLSTQKSEKGRGVSLPLNRDSGTGLWYCALAESKLGSGARDSSRRVTVETGGDKTCFYISPYADGVPAEDELGRPEWASILRNRIYSFRLSHSEPVVEICPKVRILYDYATDGKFKELFKLRVYDGVTGDEINVYPNGKGGYDDEGNYFYFSEIDVSGVSEPTQLKYFIDYGSFYDPEEIYKYGLLDDAVRLYNSKGTSNLYLTGGMLVYDHSLDKMPTDRRYRAYFRNWETDKGKLMIDSRGGYVKDEEVNIGTDKRGYRYIEFDMPADLPKDNMVKIYVYHVDEWGDGYDPISFFHESIFPAKIDGKELYVYYFD